MISAAQATNRPATPPAIDSTTLSTSDCEISRDREAPIASLIDV
jgi:hypothetical protein